MPAGLELLELLFHTVRLVRDEELRFVDVLDQLHDLVIICFINIVLLLLAVLLHLVHHLLNGRLLDLHVVGVGLHGCWDHLLFSIYLFGNLII